MDPPPTEVVDTLTHTHTSFPFPVVLPEATALGVGELSPVRQLCPPTDFEWIRSQIVKKFVRFFFNFKNGGSLKKCFFNKIRQVGYGQSGRVWIMSGRGHITIPTQKSKYFKSIGDFDGKVVTKFVHLVCNVMCNV